MGSHKQLYLGAYLKVPKNPVQVEIKRWTCLNDQCRQHSKDLQRGAKFCLSCGSSLNHQKYTVTEVVGYQHSILEGENEDEFFVLGTDHGMDTKFEYLLPNHSGTSHHDIEDSGGEYGYDGELAEEDKRLFRTRYGELMDKILAEEPGTEFKTGAITYWS